METTPQTSSPAPVETTKSKPSILEVAWNRFAQYNNASNARKKSQFTLHRWVAIIGVLATLVAIISSLYPEPDPAWRAWTIKITLILLPILSSVLAAFANKFSRGTDWLVLRAGAEQVLKEIYQYRTILQKTDKRRRTWLEKRLREIQTQVYTGLNGEMVFHPYNGTLPPPYSNGTPRIDPGFDDLDADEYFRYRVSGQLNWHVSRVNSHQRDRIRLQVLILATGALGAFLAAMGGVFGIWVALSTALATALIGWQELRNLDMTIRNYSKVILDLTSVSDHWNHLDDDERSKKEFYRMVKETETILWNQNLEYVKSMQEAFESAKMEEEDFVQQTLRSAGAGDENEKPQVISASSEGAQADPSNINKQQPASNGGLFF